MKMFYKQHTFDKYEEIEQFFFKDSFFWDGRHFVAVYPFSQHFLKFDISNQSGPKQFQVNCSQMIENFNNSAVKLK